MSFTWQVTRTHVCVNRVWMIWLIVYTVQCLGTRRPCQLTCYSVLRHLQLWVHCVAAISWLLLLRRHGYELRHTAPHHRRSLTAMAVRTYTVDWRLSTSVISVRLSGLRPPRRSVIPLPLPGWMKVCRLPSAVDFEQKKKVSHPVA